MSDSVHVQSLSTVSPNGKYLAGVTQGTRVVVRALPSMSVHAFFPAVDRVESLAWNCSSNLLLGLVNSQGIVHVWSMDDLEWTARIEAGPAGIKSVFFHPFIPSKLFTISDFNLRADFWDISEPNTKPVWVRNISGVPVPSSDGQTLALLAENSLMVLDSEFHVLFAKPWPDLNLRNARLLWIKNNKSIVIVSVEELVLVNLCDGEILKKESISRLDGKVIEAKNGILAIGCADQSVKLFSLDQGLEFLGKIDLKISELPIVNGLPVVLRETLGGTASASERNLFHLGGQPSASVEYGAINPEKTECDSVGIVKLPSTGKLAHVTAGPPRGGVCALSLSSGGQYMAVQTDEHAGLVFVVQMDKMKLVAVLIHRQPVRHFSWSESTLAVVSGDPWVHLWTVSGGCETIHLKERSMKAIHCQWTRDRGNLLISDSQSVCCVKVFKGVSEHGG